jgi:hypothetical protein
VRRAKTRNPKAVSLEKPTGRTKLPDPVWIFFPVTVRGHAPLPVPHRPGMQPESGAGAPVMADPEAGSGPARKAGAQTGRARTVPDLLSDLIREVTGLVRSEGRLARSEIAEAARTIAGGTELMAAGAVLPAVAMIVLVRALIIALARYVGPGWAATAAAAALGLLGTLLILRGQKASDRRS